MMCTASVSMLTIACVSNGGQLSNVMREVSFKDREAIVKEGELGRDFFIIREVYLCFLGSLF